jgi:hypothetical protein
MKNRFKKKENFIFLRTVQRRGVKAIQHHFQNLPG